MPMTTHPYLHSALFLILLIIASDCAAILFDPIEVYANSGELFYAEIAFRYAQPKDEFEISMANREDLQAAQLPLQVYPPIRFHLRRHRNLHQGRIVMSSTRALYPSEQTLLLKIKIGPHTYLQPIQSRLTAAGDPSHRESEAFIPLRPQAASNMPTLAAPTPTLLDHINDEIHSITAP